MKLIILNGPSGCGKTTTWLPRLSRALDAPICDTGDLFKAQLGYQRLIGSGRATSEPTTVLLGKDALAEFYASGRYAAGLAEYERQKNVGDCTGYEIIEHIETLRALCPDLPARSVRALHKVLGADLLLTTAINQQEFMNLIRLYGSAECVLISLVPEQIISRSGQNRSMASPNDDVAHTEYRYDWDSIYTVVEQAIADIKWLFTTGGSYV
jgi:hypothetical protein